MLSTHGRLLKAHARSSARLDAFNGALLNRVYDFLYFVEINMAANQLSKVLFLTTILLTSACSPNAGLIDDDSNESTTSPAPLTADIADQPAKKPTPRIFSGVKLDQADETEESSEAEESQAIGEQRLPFEDELKKRKERLPIAEDDTNETREPVGNILKIPL